jgi:2,4-dienoyl-CoA reductase-like NADH-dependent reductase (Old Yellow Enzyme family)
MAQSTLFEQTRLKSLVLKNRLVRSATCEKMSDGAGLPTARLFALYEALARGGIGLIITGLTYVARDGRIMDTGQGGIDDDACVPAYRRLTDHVHRHGAAIALQVSHAGSQTSRRRTGSRPIAPSSVINRSAFSLPRTMSTGDIRRVIEAFARGVLRAREAGFDAVQLHGAHGYLIHQFLCPCTNRRNDEWGGSLENRTRFAVEILARSRSYVGEDYPILIKLSTYDLTRNGITIDEGILTAVGLAEAGFDGIEVSCGDFRDGLSFLRGTLPVEAVAEDVGMFDHNPVARFIIRRFGSRIVGMPPITEAFNARAARAVRDRVRIPVFVVGGNTSVSAMERIVSRGDADYICLCRALVNDPNFPTRIKEGSRRKSGCIHCNLCSFYLEAGPLACYHGRRIRHNDGARPSDGRLR